jgi:hypothetical protein
VDSHGYPAFFIGTALIGLPVMALAWLASRLAGSGGAAGEGRKPD